MFIFFPLWPNTKRLLNQRLRTHDLKHGESKNQLYFIWSTTKTSLLSWQVFLLISKVRPMNFFFFTNVGSLKSSIDEKMNYLYFLQMTTCKPDTSSWRFSNASLYRCGSFCTVHVITQLECVHNAQKNKDYFLCPLFTSYTAKSPGWGWHTHKIILDHVVRRHLHDSIWSCIKDKNVFSQLALKIETLILKEFITVLMFHHLNSQK